MNSRIVKLFAFTVVMFAVLVGFTSYWTVFDSQNLKNERVNKRPLFAAQKIERGRILASDGTVIARSIRKGSGASLRYVRDYPEGSTYGHPIGYSFIEYGNSEFEAFHNSELIGDDNEFSTIFDELRGKDPVGNDIVTSLDADAQRTAFKGLADRAGAVVAIEPSTGAVKAMVSVPPYDPNLIPTDFPEMSNDPDRIMFNRPVQGQYPPGSTFKLVTAAAALDSGAITPDDTIASPATIDIQGNPLANADNTDYGEIDVTEALTHSVNTYFAQLGEELGTGTLEEYMDKFGFNAKPQLDLPEGQMSTSGVYDLSVAGGKLLTGDDSMDVGRLAIGQERLLATPIQMAEVAATIANGGDLMKPRIWSEVLDADGRTKKSMDPEKQSDVISEETADQLTEAMKDVVNEGTGTAAALSGVDVAGKTGTAEIPDVERCPGGEPNQAWFVGFAPADDPQIAVAATIECTFGQGGTDAAPIAASVMQALLDG
jgi:peptidoglycan glycosyltransferase